MQFNNTETESFSPGDSDGQSNFVETIELKDRDGAVLMTFAKAADGTFSLSFTAGGLDPLAVSATPAEINKLSGAGAVVSSGTQVENIADPTGGAVTDAEARAAVDDILDALEAFGIMAEAE